MKLTIGRRIKEMRKARKITQEQLADALSISFQAISKWENEIALPDITLVPAIASYFGVSTDELFGYDLGASEAEVEKICTEAFKYRESDEKKSREILEEGLKSYPGNEILLNNLLYVTNYTENPDETIALASKLVDTTSESDIRYDALRFLAYAYNAKGDVESAVAALEQIPEIYFTKLSELAFLLTGEPKRKAADKQKWISFETLLQMMWKLAECYESDGKIKEAITETEAAISMIEALGSDDRIKNFSNYRDYFTAQLNRMKNLQ